MTEYYCTLCDVVISRFAADDNGDVCDECLEELDMKRTDFTSEDWT